MKKTIKMMGVWALMFAVGAVEAVQITFAGYPAEAVKNLQINNKPGGDFEAGKQFALAATANAGYVFAGWYYDVDATGRTFSNEVELVGADFRTANGRYLIPSDKDAVTLNARFVTPADDMLYFDIGELFGAGGTSSANIETGGEINTNLTVQSMSLPTIAISGLPAGLVFNQSTLTLSGTVSAPGLYTVTAIGRNASGYAFSQVFDVYVESVSSKYIKTCDTEKYLSDFDVGFPCEMYLDDLFDIYNTNATIRAVTVTGLPTGLQLKTIVGDGDTHYLVSGVPTKAGTFTVKCSVTFSNGEKDEAMCVMMMLDDDPLDYGLDISALDDAYVGDAFVAEDAIIIGEFDGYAGVTAISGLPTGLTAVKVAGEGGAYSWIVKGRISKAGRFAVSATSQYYDSDGNKVSKKITAPVTVACLPGVYITTEVLTEDDGSFPTGCKVTGGGIYTAGQTVTLRATASSTYSFAGWCDYAGSPIAFDGVDYRTANASVPVEADAECELYGRFVLKTEDVPDISDLDGKVFDLDPSDENGFAASFALFSQSLPTLTMKTLPAGVEFARSADDAEIYEIVYDPATAKKTPEPGKYAIVATVVNVSRQSDVAEFLIKVPNITNVNIKVLNDYGRLTPNFPIEPISFADTIPEGATLGVTGAPTGLKYDAKTMTLSGTPTKPGEYTLKFTATLADKSKAYATAYITVKPLPEIAVVIDEESPAGCKVTGTGNFKYGAKATLKAVAAKNCVFAGWTGAGLDGFAALNPTLPYTMTTNDYTEFGATFIELKNDTLFIDDPESNTVAVVKNVPFSTNLLENVTTTRSLPTFTLTGLPTGLKYDAKTCLIAGTVGKTAKAGEYYVTIAAKNAGGYTFTKMIRFVVLENEGDEIPVENFDVKNEANIDFTDLEGLLTGGYYPKALVESIGFFVEAKSTNATVGAVAVTGLPPGLAAATTISAEDGTAEVKVYGTPTKPGLYTLKVTVTYSDRTKANCERRVIVADGGSAWLEVLSADETTGMATGSGVYASGATVKPTAKALTGKTPTVFAGWYLDEVDVFGAMVEMDGVDYRTPSPSFIFRKDMFPTDEPKIVAMFAAKEGDVAPEVDFEVDAWEIDPAVSSAVGFGILSYSLPKVTVSGLPKGVTCDVVRGVLAYDSASAAVIAPGYYMVTLKVSNTSNTKQEMWTLPVFVANKTCDAISGLSPEADAYPLYAGVALATDAIVPEVDLEGGWTLAAAGLPTGLKLVVDKGTDNKTIVGYHLEGVATKASTNTVTFTATKGMGATKETAVATITMCTAALPAWVLGAFDGAYFTIEDGATNATGSVNLNVTAAGKVSGKILKGGKSCSFVAANFTGYDAEAGEFKATATVLWSASDKEEFVVSVGENEDGVGYARLESDDVAELVQNVWMARKELGPPTFVTGAKQPTLTLEETLLCKFGENGVVTLSGKIDGIMVSGKAQVLVCNEESANAKMLVYIVNANFDDGAFCRLYNLRLMLDDSQKVSSVVSVEL